MKKGRWRSSMAGKRGIQAQQVLAKKARSPGWHTSDAEEIEQRRRRAVEEALTIQALEAPRGMFGTFRVHSESGSSYDVEIRSLTDRLNSCGCPDHRVNGLGTCKHVEAVIAHLGTKHGGGLERAAQEGARRVEIFLDNTTEEPQVQVRWPRRAHPELRDLIDPFFSTDGVLLADPAAAIPALARRLETAPIEQRRRIRLSRHLLGWAEERGRQSGRQRSREAFLADVAAGKRTLDLVSHPLYPYQQEGLLFLAFTERALLGDEMGLGKTVQAIAACELLRRLRGVERVLVVSPVSLKAEWEEQIGKFTGLPARIIAGPRGARLRQYRERSFFYLTNYEQVVSDGPDIQQLLAPDVVILDEAQRIKNWRTKTARAVKRLESRYAFVLTGTPLENRIDDLYSIVQFLDPGIFGPLFHFNRDFYELDDSGRPVSYQNLGELHRRLKPILLRRRKEEVEDQLPPRTINTYFVAMHPEQTTRYAEYRARVARLLTQARRRPLSPEEFEKLQGWLACMRMLCDTPYILDPDCRVCPKLGELEEILRESLAEDGRKVLVFSEWERMLELVRELAEAMEVGFAWHTGSVPQLKRRDEIRRFKNDPACRLFLSTDSGSVGLNLQAASVVINLDMPWNPARLEQRIARAWRKHQPRSVQVINLVTEDSIEHRMLHLLAGKQALAEGLLDGKGELDTLPLPSGRSAFIGRLEEIMGSSVAAEPAPTPAEPLERLRQDLVAGLGDGLLLLETHAAQDGRTTVLAVIGRLVDAAQARGQAEAALRRHVDDGGEPAHLELLDQATFEAVERLAAAGIVQLAPAGRLLHRSPALADPQAVSVQRRLLLARQCFARGERNQRMATLLAEGGFPGEALPPLAEAVQAALMCLAHLAGLTVGDGEELPLNAIEALRQAPPPAGGLAAEALPLAARLQERVGAFATVPDEEARAWVREGSRLCARIEDSLSREALGVAEAR
jgi:superfamily II DNA or RNA helicase